MNSDNDNVRKVHTTQESPFSMSEEDTPDSLEIKPPQASIYKTQRIQKEKHSSHKSHNNSSEKASSSSQHKSHHRSRHRDDRERRHHHHKEKDRERKKFDSSGAGGMIAEVEVKTSDHKHRERSDSSYKSHRRREEDRKYREERKNRNDDRKNKEYRNDVEEYNVKDKDLRYKLEGKKHFNPLKEKEKIERELRKERFLEAERVKEAYKDRVKDVEQKRKRYRSRSKSPTKSKNDSQYDENPPEVEMKRARTRKEMEDAGLVVLTDESRSPTPQRFETSSPPAQDEEVEQDQQQSYESDKDSSDSENDSSSSEESGSSSDPDTKEEERGESTDRNDYENDNVSPNVMISSNMQDSDIEMEIQKDTLPPYLPAIQGCRSVEEFRCLNRIEEGTYGVVYRAKDKRTEEIVALKRLKMEKEKEGFPITSLREINTLLKAQHPNIVTVREIVVGSNMDKIFIVMDYVEHDMKSLMETMKSKKQVFVPGEVKCLMQQLLHAVAHLHDNWILHRDLKTSNLLLSHKGILKVGDFGLAREYGSPLKHYTPIVVTLWYRAPELLLGCKEYSTPIDVWSVGCIFSEFLNMEPLFPGKSDPEQLVKIFKTLGTPNEKIWPGFTKLPVTQKVTFAEYPNTGALKVKTAGILSEQGHDLLMKFLTYDPFQRITAEEALKHDYFTETPLPIDPSMFPTWPAKSELGHKKAMSSPKPPSGGQNYKQLEDNEEGFHMGIVERSRVTVPGFSLKF